jgi:hypothetical protein
MRGERTQTPTPQEKEKRKHSKQRRHAGQTENELRTGRTFFWPATVTSLGKLGLLHRRFAQCPIRASALQGDHMLRYHLYHSAICFYV